MPHFNSDAAVKNLLAQEIFATGRYFPPEWNYVNGDLWVFGGHTFILPWLKFFPNGFNLHALSGIITAAMVLLGAWLLSEWLKFGRNYKIMFVALLAGGFSPVMRVILYGEAAYAWPFSIICVLLYCAGQALAARRKYRRYFLLGVFVIFGLVAWGNPVRALVTYGLPLTAAVIAYVYFAGCRVPGKSRVVFFSALKLSGVLISGALIGTLLHAETLSLVTSVPGAASARWLSLPEMVTNSGYTGYGFLALFGGIPEAGSAVVGISGAYAALRLLSALLLLILLPVSLYRVVCNGSVREQFVAVFAGVSLALVLLIQVATTVPDMNDPVSSSRYLVPALLLGLIAVIALLQTGKAGNLFRLPGFFVVLVLLSGTSFSFYQPVAAGGSRSSFPMRLARFLESQGLEYGYATFWNAGAVTVLSSGRVKVRQITFSQKLPVPYRWLGSNRWYRPSAWSGRTFLVLNQGEVDSLDWPMMRRYNGPAEKVLKFEGLKIFVYAQNIAVGLPHWDAAFELPRTFYAETASNTEIGRFVPAGAAGEPARLEAAADCVGCLHFGPYVKVLPGTYKVVFDLSAGDGSLKQKGLGPAKIDVVCASGKIVLAEKNITGSDDLPELTFRLDSPARVEFRVYAAGRGRVEFRSVSIVRVQPQPRARPARTS